MAVLGDLQIDVVESEQPTLTNTVTQRPVEKETDISDHIKQQPIQIQLKTYFADPDASGKYDELLSMRDSEEIYTYSGASGIYDNMAIKEISPLKNASYGNGFECSISLMQIRIVELEEVQIQVGVDPVTGEQVQDSVEQSEIEERQSREDEVDEETADPTSLKVLQNKVTDFFSDDGVGDEE